MLRFGFLSVVMVAGFGIVANCGVILLCLRFCGVLNLWILRFGFGGYSCLLFDCVWCLLVRYCVCLMRWLFLRIFVVWLFVLGLLLRHACLVLASGDFGFWGWL